MSHRKSPLLIKVPGRAWNARSGNLQNLLRSRLFGWQRGRCLNGPCQPCQAARKPIKRPVAYGKSLQPKAPGNCAKVPLFLTQIRAAARTIAANNSAFPWQRLKGAAAFASMAGRHCKLNHWMCQPNHWMCQPNHWMRRSDAPRLQANRLLFAHQSSLNRIPNNGFDADIIKAV